AEAFLAELRGRCARPPAEVLARARAALQDMDQAQIGTIHSFAAHLLRLYPLQAGLDPGFRVDEGPAFAELFETRWSQWLDAELGEHDCGPRREEWLAVLCWAPLEDLEELARGLAGSAADLAQAGRPDPGTPARLEELAQALRRAPQGQPAPKGKSRILEALSGLAAHLERLAAAAASPEPALGRLRALEAPQSKWPAVWDEAGRPAYESAQRIASAASAESEALVRRAARLVAPFAEAFRRDYARAGLVSFDGLLLKARDLVRGDLSVREQLKARYRTFLVDEFQDTDPLQGELLLFLAEEPGGRARTWDRVRPGAGRLFIVGDPKQSIYRFRGADIAAYQGITGHLLQDGGALLCELRTNFRSTAAVLAPVNAVFPKLMRRKEGSQPDYIPVEPAAPSGEGGTAAAVEIVAAGPEREGGEEPDAPASQKAQSAWIAGWISAQCQEIGGRRFKDVAVLMRTSSALAPLLDAFKAAAIPYVVEMEKLFYNSQEVIDLSNLLRVLDDPEDRLALAGLLRSPLLGLADEDLRLWAEAGRPGYQEEPPASWPAAERRRLAKLYAVLRGLRSRVGRVPLGELVSAALAQTPLLAAAAGAYHGQQSVSNLLKFSRLAAAAADERGATLKEFISMVARAMDESRAEGESPLADEHLDAVRVLSIHKAKGLEFPAVLVYNLSGGSARGGEGRAVLSDWSSGRAGLSLNRCGACDAARALLEDRERERRQDETVRLLYVALTRAQSQLILLGQRKAAQGTLAGLLSEAGAWPADGGLGSLPVHVVRAGPAAQRASPGRRAGLKCAHRLPGPEALARVRAERLARRDAAAARVWTRSATGYLQEECAPVPSGRGERHPSRDGGPLPAGALVGQLCHKVLALWDFRSPADPAAAVAAACLGSAMGQPEADWAAARGEAEKVLRAF
ncbi:MAG: UvrD-helicase domain-containing protein, partial [Elusimicrobia bacterium]|nr:UvrD-helicase domain-containing protein [Elusimicrobiota bacterium]